MEFGIMKKKKKRKFVFKIIFPTAYTRHSTRAHKTDVIYPPIIVAEYEK